MDFGLFSLLLPRPDAKFSLEQLSSPFFFLDGFSVVFPFCSPGLMRISAFSSFPPFFSLQWIFGCFPFLLPRPDANFSFRQLSSPFFFPTMDFQLFSLFAPPA